MYLIVKKKLKYITSGILAYEDKCSILLFVRKICSSDKNFLEVVCCQGVYCFAGKHCTYCRFDIGLVDRHFIMDQINSEFKRN